MIISHLGGGPGHNHNPPGPPGMCLFVSFLRVLMLYIHFEPFNQRYSHLTFNLSTNVIHLFSYLKLGTDDDDQPGPPGPGPNKHRKLFKL